MWCLVTGTMSLSSISAHLVIHRESNLMHCLDGYLGSTYSGRDGRSEREWVQGSTQGWLNGTWKYGDKGWGGVIGSIPTVGKELCGALLSSLTSAYHWVGVICNGGWCGECPVYPADRNPSKWVQADGYLVPPSIL